MKPTIDTRTAADLCGVSLPRIRQFVSEGRLVPVGAQAGGHLFDAAAVRQFAKSGRKRNRKGGRIATLAWSLSVIWNVPGDGWPKWNYSASGAPGPRFTHSIARICPLR